MLSGSEVAFLNRTFVAVAFRALKEELDPFPATKTTHCIGISCQVILLALDDRFTGLASPFVPDKIIYRDEACLVSACQRDAASRVSTARLCAVSAAGNRYVESESCP